MEDFIRPYKEKFYTSPVWLHQIIGFCFKFISPNIRYGKEFRNVSSLLLNSQNWSIDRIKKYQEKELSQLLDNALKNVPFYKKWFNEMNGIELQKNPWELLKSLPFVTREMLRENTFEFINENKKPNNMISVTTGGSTGVPIHFFHERGVTNPAEKAFQWRQRNWAGYYYGDPVVIIRGRGLGGDRLWKKEPFDNALVVSAYHLKDEYLSEIVDRIITHKPIAIQAYPSNAMILADYIQRMCGVFPGETLKVLLCGSENLFDFQRAYLEKIFKCRVYSWYGQTEYVVLAGGCDHSDKYHIYPEYGYTELIRPDGSLIEKAGEIGEIVGTSFYNYAMPLIRYRTGDFAEYDDAFCECGRNYRIFKTVYGREQNFVVLQDNRLVSLTGLIFGQHFKAFTNIEKFQLEQHVPGAITIRLIKSNNFNDQDLFEIKGEFRKCVGESLLTNFEFVDEIKPTKSGKYLFLIQHIDIKKYLTESKGIIEK